MPKFPKKPRYQRDGEIINKDNEYRIIFNLVIFFPFTTGNIGIPAF
mgnify:CR=1 FL=1